MGGDGASETGASRGAQRPTLRLLQGGGKPRAHRLRTLAWAIFWTAFIVAVGSALILEKNDFGLPLIATAFAFGALTLPYQAYAYSSIGRDVAFRLAGRPGRLVAFPAAIIAVYLVYAVATGCFSWWACARLSAFVCVPTALVLWSGQKPGITWQDALAIFCIWVPFDTGMLDAIWAWPAGEGAYVINTSLAITLGVTLFVCWRGYSDVRFRFVWSWREVRLAAVMLLGFMVVGMPFGFLTGFLTYNPQLEPAKVLGAPLGIFFFIAVPEELLFRGLIQNYLKRLFGSPVAGLIVASVFFGATHLNNPPLYDWRFFVLATVAGIFYGATYEKARSLLAPALLHAAVDVVWLLLLHT